LTSCKLAQRMRLPGLDGIRAISISLVLLFHLTASAGLTPWTFGGFGVTIFFVLSGFLITWLLCGEEARRGSISLPSFYARRALRILPPAMTYLAAVCILSRYGFTKITWADVGGCVFFVRNLMTGSEATDHYWSLSVEEQFYLLWPLGMILLRSNRARLKVALVLVLIAPLWRFINVRLSRGVAFVDSWRFGLGSDAILVGCCLALLRNDVRLSTYLRTGVLQSWWLPAAAIAGVIGSLRTPHAAALAPVFVALFINYAVDHPTGWGLPLNWAPMVWLGKVSYSLYIWQQLFCWDSGLGWLGRFPQNLAAALLMASLSYYLIEQAFANLRKRVPSFSNPRILARFAPLE
jgi:peptidoglycan/LPS O-acetylase OafA/YrhL